MVDWIEKVWISKENYDLWLKWKGGTDNRFIVSGGAVSSNGEMTCQLSLMTPLLDRRFKSGKRYVEATKILAVKKHLATPYPEYENVGTVESLGWVEIEVPVTYPAR